MKIAYGIEMLEVSANLMGKTNTVHPTLLWDKDMAVLVDTGFQLPTLCKQIELAGVPFSAIQKVILTHQDLDHIGALPAILQESSEQIEVLANEIEKPYIQGDKKLLRLTEQAVEKALSAIPKDLPKEVREKFTAVFQNPPKGKVDRTVTNGEELPYCGGIIVIDTPGHTPGHISLYHKPSKTLIAGDALIVEDGLLLGPVPQLALDLDTALSSLQQFTQFDIENVICYHGGLFQDNVNMRIKELAEACQK